MSKSPDLFPGDQVPVALEDNHDPGFVERGGAQFEQKRGGIAAIFCAESAGGALRHPW